MNDADEPDTWLTFALAQIAERGFIGCALGIEVLCEPLAPDYSRMRNVEGRREFRRLKSARLRSTL